MNKFLLFIELMPIQFLSVYFFTLFLAFYLFQYFYISYNLKGILKIMFDDETYYKVPLTYSKFYILSLLPIVFWREALNIKTNMHFKILYGQVFYFWIQKYQLIKLLEEYPCFFRIQYATLFFGILWIIFLFIAHILQKYY